MFIMVCRVLTGRVVEVASREGGRTMRRNVIASTVVCACIVAVLAAVSPAPKAKKVAVGTHRPATVLYKQKAGATPAALKSLNGVLNGRGAKTVRRLKGLGVNVTRYADSKVSVAALCAELKATGAVEYAEPDYLVSPVLLPNDPSYSSQWQHSKINSPGAWDTTTGNASVLVAVCDTGVSSAHPDLAANLQLPGYNAVDGSTNTEPVYNHGTSVAGCIGAVGNNGVGVAGVAWTTKILPVRITNRQDGNAYISDAADGIRYAADQGAKVANLSYLMADSATIDSAAQYLRGKGGLLFVAAGNDGKNQSWPDFTSFIAVGATTSTDVKASWSTYGAFVDIAAPGSDVYTTSGSSGYESVSGTSFASPIAAGLGAILYGINPSFTPTQVETFIFNSCVDLGDPGEDNLYGHGRINAAAAVDYALNTPPVASAAATPLTGAAPLEVTFDATGSQDLDGEIVSYQWAFGDGATDTGITATHTYASEGAHTATLTVTDDKGATNSDQVTITVTPAPIIGIHVHDIAMSLVAARGGTRAHAKVAIVDEQGAPRPGAVVTGSWTGPKASTVSGTTAADGTVELVSNKAKGALTYTFTVTNVTTSGSTYDSAKNVETSDSISSGTAANQSPTAKLTATPTSGLAPLDVAFNGSASSDLDGQIVSYAWDLGDGETTTGATVSHTYSAVGSYTATLTVTDDKGAKDSKDVTITVTDGSTKKMYVKSIVMAPITSVRSTKAQATVTIVDIDGVAVAGVTVTGTWSGLVSGSAQAVTNANGAAVMVSRKTRKSGTFTFTVTDASLAGYVYDPSLNVESSDSLAK
jgi:PKD repeat protein